MQNLISDQLQNRIDKAGRRDRAEANRQIIEHDDRSDAVGNESGEQISDAAHGHNASAGTSVFQQTRNGRRQQGDGVLALLQSQINDHQQKPVNVTQAAADELNQTDLQQSGGEKA